MEMKMTARLLSFNILTHELYGRENYRLYGNQTAEDYSFAARLPRMLALFRYTKPHVVMLQELSGPKYWGTVLDLTPVDDSKGIYVSPHFKNYAWVNYGNRYGVPYADNQTKRNPFDAHNMIMYDTEKFELLASGTFFLTEDGTRESCWRDQSGAYCSIFADIGDCTWILLRDRESGVKAIYATTHSYLGSIQRVAYHVENLQILTDRLCALAEEYGEGGRALPVVVAGDFNVSPRRRNTEHSYEHMVRYAGFDDAKEVAPISDESGTARVYGNDMGGRDGTSANGERIDFFFLQGMDVHRYSVLSGMFREDGKDLCEYEHENPAFDGTMYDFSDHQPIYCEVSIGEGETYASHRVDPKDFYRNPETEGDVLVTANEEKPPITARLNFQRQRFWDFVGGDEGGRISAAAVRDGEKGIVLRFHADGNTGSVRGLIRADGLFGRFADEMEPGEWDKVCNAKELRVTFKTQLSIAGVDLRFFVVTEGAEGEGQYRLAKLPTDRNGEWRTLTVDLSGLSGRIAKMGVYGGYKATGLLRGDAIYIESIEFV